MRLISAIEGISSVSNWDYFYIQSSLMSDKMDRVNCFKCVKLKNHEKTKSIQNCTTISERILFPTEDFNYKTCVGKFRLVNWSNIVMLCNLFNQGINPFGGALTDVPNKLVEVSNILHNFKVEQQIEEEKKWQTKSKSKSR